HVSSGVRSAGCNLIATRVFGMSETIAITGKSVKLFKGHYTSTPKKRLRRSVPAPPIAVWFTSSSGEAGPDDQTRPPGAFYKVRAENVRHAH
ncbi:MAG: hypothetical protein ACREYE_31480, partial [Gammaproteobacteria bacterium]